MLPEKKILCPSSLRSLCEKCWDQDPAQRPTFEQIIALLDTQVLVDTAIFSSKGRKLWKTCFVAGEVLRETVPFAEFLECFCRYFTDDGAVPRSSDASYKCMRDVFCGRDGQEEVRLATFGRMLGFFGPLDKVLACVRFCLSLTPKNNKETWLPGLLETLREPWFWGETSREVACQKLAAEPRGTFLVRYASEDSYFTISYVALNQQGKKEIFHTRVVHAYASSNYVIPTTRAGSRTCASLLEVVAALREGTSQLMHRPCAGGPYASFFAETSVDSGYGYQGGYQAADVDADFPEDSGPAAISGSLKESSVAFPRHLVMPNNSNSPMLPAKNNSPAPAKKK